MNATRGPLSEEQVEAFVSDGFVRVEGAFSADQASAARDALWEELPEDRDAPDTWTREVVRMGVRGDPPFVESANTSRLHAAYDQLCGAGNWKPPSLIGTFPIRFPTDKPTDGNEDYGWHIDHTYLATDAEVDTDIDWEGELPLLPPNFREVFLCNLWSRGRLLVMLHLYSDTGEADAPTLIRVGSHLDVPPLLADVGAHGTYLDVGDVGEGRPLATATGQAGDVYLCHPFLVHTPIAHHGTRPRFMSQPILEPAEPFGQLNLDPRRTEHTPVERAVLRGLELHRAPKESNA